MTIGVLLLAAGISRRFGADKRHAQVPGGKTLLQSTIERIQASELPLLVCLAAGDIDTAGMLREQDIACYCCHNSTQGMGATLAEGVGQIGTWDGVLIGLADMPYIEAATYRAVAGQLTADSICVPISAGQRGHPVGFGTSFFSSLAGLGGDEGAKSLLGQHADKIVQLEVADAGILRDIDRPEDL